MGHSGSNQPGLRHAVACNGQWSVCARLDKGACDVAKAHHVSALQYKANCSISSFLPDTHIIMQHCLALLQDLKPAGNSLGSIGGFCAGDRDVVDHQRLSGLGYCYSASLPPYLATAAICALQSMQKQPELVQQVADNAKVMRGLLQQVDGLQVMQDWQYNVSVCNARTALGCCILVHLSA